MNNFYRYILKKIAAKLVIQGYSHRANIVAMYSVIINASRKEFSEDNKPTLDYFLEECHIEALQNSNHPPSNIGETIYIDKD